MKKILILLFALFVSNTVLAANDYVYEYTQNYKSMRAMGMGSVRTTTALYDDALFSNPARHSFNPKWKLTLINPLVEVNSGVLKTVNDAKSVKFDGDMKSMSKFAGRNHHARFAMTPLALYIPSFFFDTSFAFAPLVNFQTNTIIGKNNAIYTQTMLDAGLNAGVSKAFYEDRLFVGVNLHGLYRVSADKGFSALDILQGKKITLSSENAGAGQGFGVDADLGAYYKIPVTWKVKPNAGISLNNILNQKYSMGVKPIKNLTSNPTNQPRVFNIGGNLEFPEFGPLSNGVVAVEINNILREGGKFKHVNIGGEVKLISILAFRAGLNQGYPTAGLGIDLPLVKIDIATSAEELGLNSGTRVDRRYAAQFALEI